MPAGVAVLATRLDAVERRAQENQPHIDRIVSLDQWKESVTEELHGMRGDLKAISRWLVGLLGTGITVLVVEVIRLLAAKQ